MSYAQLQHKAQYVSAAGVPEPADDIICLRVVLEGQVQLYVFHTVNEVAEAAFTLLTSDEGVTADAIFNGRTILWKNDGISAHSRLLKLI
jgi:hypothetical protein